jgi:outer membrane protein assembly factor BamB
VGQLDGVLKGIDTATGETIWQFDSGSPLVSAHTPDSLSRGRVNAPTFFPGADGGLYHYNQGEGKLEVSFFTNTSFFGYLLTVSF